MTAPHVDDALEAREVERRENGRQSLRGSRRHCRVENGPILGMGLRPLEESLTVEAPESRCARANGFVELTERAPHEVRPEHERPRPDAVGMVGA